MSAREPAGGAEEKRQGKAEGPAPAPAPLHPLGPPPHASHAASSPERGAGADLRRLTQIARALDSELELHRLLDLILDSVVELARAERAFLILRNKENKPEVVASRNFDREGVKRAAAKISRSILVQTEKTGRPILTTNATLDPRFANSDSVAYMRLRAVLCIPLASRGSSLGVLYLDNRFEEGVFREVDLGLIEAFGAQAAIALENARLNQENLRRRKELEQSKEKVEELNKVLREQVRKQGTELARARQALRERHTDTVLKYSYPEMIGSSRRMVELYRLLDRVIDTQVPVLIQGESGTGKELVTRAVHFQGSRKKGPFITENCSAIPDTLLESELFGYVRGAFTGADHDREGLIVQADGGTLFLDEIGDMPPEMQAKLLRVLEVGEVRPVGGKKALSVDVRIVAASNRDLRKMVREGTFREDLFYRLAVITVDVPPLRERREDIPALVQRFLEVAATEARGEPKEMSEEALALLVGFDWPGNVRELRNEVLRACALSEKVILPEVLSDEIRRVSIPRSPAGRLEERPLRDVVRDTVETVERRVLEEALRRANWKKSETARILGISRPTLDAKIAQYGLSR